ncbi:hypothetical protein DIPPA_26223 [Diplonema papillatum]|nr:hypothetical protein DIPPA_26223 [Diplonema papillatum]
MRVLAKVLDRDEMAAICSAPPAGGAVVDRSDFLERYDVEQDDGGGGRPLKGYFISDRRADAAAKRRYPLRLLRPRATQKEAFYESGCSELISDLTKSTAGQPTYIVLDGGSMARKWALNAASGVLRAALEQLFVDLNARNAAEAAKLDSWSVTLSAAGIEADAMHDMFARRADDADPSKRTPQQRRSHPLLAEKATGVRGSRPVISIENVQHVDVASAEHGATLFESVLPAGNTHHVIATVSVSCTKITPFCTETSSDSVTIQNVVHVVSVGSDPPVAQSKGGGVTTTLGFREALSNCLTGLKNASAAVPFARHKLTLFLRPALTGLCGTCWLLTLAPCASAKHPKLSGDTYREAVLLSSIAGQASVLVPGPNAANDDPPEATSAPARQRTEALRDEVAGVGRVRRKPSMGSFDGQTDARCEDDSGPSQAATPVMLPQSRTSQANSLAGWDGSLTGGAAALVDRAARGAARSPVALGPWDNTAFDKEDDADTTAEASRTPDGKQQQPQQQSQQPRANVLKTGPRGRGGRASQGGASNDGGSRAGASPKAPRHSTPGAPKTGGNPAAAATTPPRPSTRSPLRQPAHQQQQSQQPSCFDAASTPKVRALGQKDVNGGTGVPSTVKSGFGASKGASPSPPPARSAEPRLPPPDTGEHRGLLPVHRPSPSPERTQSPYRHQQISLKDQEFELYRSVVDGTMLRLRNELVHAQAEVEELRKARSKKEKLWRKDQIEMVNMAKELRAATGRVEALEAQRAQLQGEFHEELVKLDRRQQALLAEKVRTEDALAAARAELSRRDPNNEERLRREAEQQQELVTLRQTVARLEQVIQRQADALDGRDAADNTPGTDPTSPRTRGDAAADVHSGGESPRSTTPRSGGGQSPGRQAPQPRHKSPKPHAAPQMRVGLKNFEERQKRWAAQAAAPPRKPAPKRAGKPAAKPAAAPPTRRQLLLQQQLQQQQQQQQAAAAAAGEGKGGGEPEWQHSGSASPDAGGGGGAPLSLPLSIGGGWVDEPSPDVPEAVSPHDASASARSFAKSQTALSQSSGGSRPPPPKLPPSGPGSRRDSGLKKPLPPKPMPPSLSRSHSDSAATHSSSRSQEFDLENQATKDKLNVALERLEPTHSSSSLGEHPPSNAAAANQGLPVVEEAAAPELKTAQSAAKTSTTSSPTSETTKSSSTSSSTSEMVGTHKTTPQGMYAS